MAEIPRERRRLAVVQTKPTQFDGPLFALLSECPDLDFSAYFSRRHAKTPGSLDRETGISANWGSRAAAGYAHRYAGPGFPGLVSLTLQIIRSKPDLVVVAGYVPLRHFAIALACRLAGVRVGLRSDSTLLHSPSSRRRLRLLLKGLGLPLVLRIFNSGHPVGRLAREYLLAYGMKRERIFEFPYSVDNDWLAEQAAVFRERRDELRASLGIAPDSFVVLGVVKFVDREDPTTLLCGFEQLRKQVGSAHLVLVGDGPLMGQLQQAVRERQIEGVHLPGYVAYEKLPLYYAVADVFVHPPRRESWGVSVNEAMACGLPVVVSSMVGSSADLVEPDATGQVFEVGNSSSLSARLLEMASDRERTRRMGENARRLVDNWSYRVVVDNLRRALAFAP
jgi:glycosyltransferase involved in cell wall biosynthesis